MGRDGNEKREEAKNKKPRKEVEIRF